MMIMAVMLVTAMSCIFDGNAPSPSEGFCSLVSFARHQTLTSLLSLPGDDNDDTGGKNEEEKGKKRQNKPHGREEQKVEDDQGGAGDQLDEDGSEPGDQDDYWSR